MDDRLAQLEVIERPECLALLARRTIGRVGLVVDGRPEVLPVNFVMDGDSVLFRTAEGSPLTQAASTLVAFEVDDIDESTSTGWSVLVHGFAEDIGDTIDGTSERLRRLDLPTWAPGARERWFHVVPDSITGRRITSSPMEL
jgi:nitroimidazol reductase NimA-like FMN-containing flavoprotein (pyridoxamine 5'-phosphate oxidase superfamily)